MYGNPYYQPYYLTDDELEHYGILGMKWGIRRYQNPDGTLTEAGKKRLDKYKFKESNRVSKRNTQYQRAVDRAAARRAKSGKIQKPEAKKKERQRLSDYKKELSVIKKLKYSDMEKELKIKRSNELNAIAAQIAFGLPGQILERSIISAIGEDSDTKIRRMRLEIYDELNKKDKS